MSAPVDGDWDYNAPQFVDFSEPTVTEMYDDGADSYFNFDHENGIPVRFSMINGKRVSVAVDINQHATTTEKDTNVTASTNDESSISQNSNESEVSVFVEKGESTKETLQNTPEATEETTEKVKIPRNIIKSFTAWKVKHTPGKDNGVTSSGNKKMQRQRARQQHMMNMDKKITTTTQIRNRIQSVRRSPRVKAQMEPNRRKTKSLDGPATKKLKADEPKKHETPAAKKPKLTLPSTPICLKRNAVKPGTAFKTSEQLEMEKIAELRHQLAEKRRLAEESMKKAQSSQPAPVRTKCSVTRPEEFHFATDDRLKAHPMTTRGDAKEIDFKSSLRSHPPSPHNAKKGPTKAVPFHFNERKRKISETHDEPVYKSMAVLVNEFQSKTPDRYRMKPRSRGNTPQMKRKPCSKLTMAKTPSLETRHRKRNYTVMSAQDKEDQEVEEMKQFKFKANPVNPTLFNDHVPPKKPAKKKCTEAVGFEFESSNRTVAKKPNKAKEEEKFEFHARPVPTKILEGPVGISEKKRAPITAPKSPAFALKNRVRAHKADESIREEKPIKFARPVPQPGVAFKPVIEHKHTEPKPFTFDERDKERLAKKEEKIQQVYLEEKKAREFKAQMLPSPTEKGVPVKKSKEITKPEPFNLRVEERGAIAAEEWTRKMEEDLKQQRAKASAFKARPLKVVYEEPFVPEKPNRVLSDMKPFQLNTEQRAQDREDFEYYKKRKESDLAEEKMKREREREEEEKEEVKNLRNKMVHKSNPIRHFKEVHVSKSTRPLTTAESPHLRTSRRRTDVL